MPTKKTAKKATKKPAKKVASTKPPKAAKPTRTSKPPAARMTLKEVMVLLEKAGSEQTRKTYARHGATGPMFGVKFGDLFKLMKRIDVDHDLARELWATGNVDARNLAMKVVDPRAITPKELDRWAVENPMPMCVLYIASIAAESPHGAAKAREWLSSKDERLRANGWTLLGRLSDRDESFPESELLRRIEEIEKSIHSAPNEVRAEMNKTLGVLGGRSPALRKAATAAAKRIGVVTVDQGGTACKTPDAAEVITKLWERSGTKFPSPAAAERSRESMRRRC